MGLKDMAANHPNRLAIILALIVVATIAIAAIVSFTKKRKEGLDSLPLMEDCPPGMRLSSQKLPNGITEAICVGKGREGLASSPCPKGLIPKAHVLPDGSIAIRCPGDWV